MEELLLKYIAGYGGFGVLLLYLYYENKKKDATIREIMGLYNKKEELWNQRIDTYVQKSVDLMERNTKALLQVSQYWEKNHDKED